MVFFSLENFQKNLNKFKRKIPRRYSPTEVISRPVYAFANLRIGCIDFPVVCWGDALIFFRGVFPEVNFFPANRGVYDNQSVNTKGFRNEYTCYVRLHPGRVYIFPSRTNKKLLFILYIESIFEKSDTKRENRRLHLKVLRSSSPNPPPELEMDLPLE